MTTDRIAERFRAIDPVDLELADERLQLDRRRKGTGRTRAEQERHEDERHVVLEAERAAVAATRRPPISRGSWRRPTGYDATGRMTYRFDDPAKDCS